MRRLSMIGCRNHLLLLVYIATVTAGPAATANLAVSGSLQEINPNHWNKYSEVAEPDAQTPYQQHGPPLNVLQDVVHGVMPPPLWDVVFEDHLKTISGSNSDSKTSKNFQQQRSWMTMLAPFYLPNVTDVSPKCRRDVNAIGLGVLEGMTWAIKVVDSWGKMSDGVLAGNTMAIGLLDECLMTKVDSDSPDAHFKGQYCSFSVGMKPTPQRATWNNMAEEDEELYQYYEDDVGSRVSPQVRMANVKGALQIALPYNLLATCIPSTCTKEEYQDSLAEELDLVNLTLASLDCQTKDLPTLQNNTATIIMMVAVCLLAILVVVGTVTDIKILITKNEQLGKGPLRYVLIFSLYTNLPKIFRINVQENKDTISCLHAIRVLSMCWVVIGHAYLLSIIYSANKGLLAEMIKEHPYFYQLILNAYPSVDTFFVMSGLLVGYNLTKEFQRTKTFNVLLYYIHRIIRLLPPILLLCGFFAVFPPLFVQGVLSPSLVKDGGLVDNCVKYWWRDSFFIVNFFTGVDNGLSCLPVSWYLACEFQLYIVTPIIFLPLLYYRKYGYVIFGLFVAASIAVPMAIIGHYQLPPNTVLDITIETSTDFMTYVYGKPWCRASPYLVGLATGYMLMMVDKDKLKMTWWHAVMGWIVALAVMTAVVLGLKEYNTMTGFHEYDAAISIIYGGLHRLGWGMAICWMIFACHMGYGGPINSFLAHPAWQPLSRLTYAIFLIAFNAQTLYYIYYLHLPTYFTPFYRLMETAGILLISGFGALPVSLLSESPILGLEKLLLRKPRPKQNKQIAMNSPEVESPGKGP